MVVEANKLISEIDDVGGMVKAIEMGIPKMRIEESSAKRQAKVDSEEQIIVGVNKYKPTEKQDINILSIDNDKVRKKQISALNELKKSRDNKIVDKYIKKVEEVAKGNGDKYRMIFKTENLVKVMAGNYEVSISSKGVSEFKNKDVPLTYWISTETGSKYEAKGK